MERKTYQGYLVIGDISGYTSYVASTELEHSQAVLTELLTLIIEKFRALLILVKLEGDAVFAHVPAERVLRGETVLELIESTYYAFRNRVEQIRHLTTCECRACRQIPSLDLKFIVHFGEYYVQNMMGVNDLVGSDVNLIHRLTKNRLFEATRWKAYALFTQKALDQIGIHPDGMYAQVETYEHLGEIQTHSMDLHERYHEMREANRTYISSAEADIVIALDINAPPPIVWEWVSDPRRKNMYMDGTSWSDAVRPGGRTRRGAVNHCAHGKDELSIEKIDDWRPFEYYTTSGNEEEEKLTMQVTYYFKPLEEGEKTHLEIMAKVVTKQPRIVGKLFAYFWKSLFTKKIIPAMVEMIEHEMAGFNLMSEPIPRIDFKAALRQEEP